MPLLDYRNKRPGLLTPEEIRAGITNPRRFIKVDVGKPFEPGAADRIHDVEMPFAPVLDPVKAILATGAATGRAIGSLMDKPERGTGKRGAEAIFEGAKGAYDAVNPFSEEGQKLLVSRGTPEAHWCQEPSVGRLSWRCGSRHWKRRRSSDYAVARRDGRCRAWWR